MLKQICRMAVFAVFVLSGLSVWADTHVTYTDEQGKVADQFYVKDGKVRIEKQGSPSISIYDPAANSLLVMIPSGKLYFLLDSQSVAQFGAALQGAMQAHAARQQATSATGQSTAISSVATGPGNYEVTHTNSPDTAQLTERDLSTTETVLGHTCNDIETSLNGRKFGDYCAVNSVAELGLPEADLKALDAMHTGTQSLAAQMGSLGEKLLGFTGKHFIYLKATHPILQNGKFVISTETLQSVTTAPLDAHIFDVPAGYGQISIEELVQAMHPKTTAAPAATRP